MEKMLKIWLTVLSMASLSAQASYMEDVEKYTKKFLETTEFGKDPAEGMKNLTGNLEELFTLGKPIGALLASDNPNEEQQIALSKINETIYGKFEKLRESSEKDGEFTRNSIHYMNEVYYNIVTLSLHYSDAAIKFNSIREIYRNIFEKECRAKVPVILKHLKQNYLPPACSLPSKEYALTQAKILQSFNALQPYFYIPEDTRFKTFPEPKRKQAYDGFENFTKMKNWILRIINLANKTEVDGLFRVLEASKTKPKELLNYITDRESSLVWSEENAKCQLDYVVKVSSYARSELTARLNQLRFDMTILAGVSSACANLISNGNSEKEQQFLNEVRRNITEIGDFLVSWMERAIELPWPEIDMEMVKTSLISQVSLSSKELEKYANILQTSLNQRAPPGYYHQVLMVENTKFGVLTQEPTNYWNLKYGKYMIHVFRLKLHKENEKIGHSQWFHENYDQMKKQIADSQSLSADMLLKNLDETFNLIGENRWTAALQVRKEAIFCSWGEMNGALGATNGTGYSDVSEIRTQHNAWYRCSNSRIFLFV